jgi:glycosyltransferase involved in cell wall biosynthesis
MGGEERAVSVVVPVYNGAATLPALVDRVASALRREGVAVELVLVNDGSRDESWHVIQELAKQYSFVHGIRLMRNFGQHNALLAGVRAARYPIIVTMDADLEHLPEEIPLLLAKLDEGHDLVYGIPKRLPHTLWRNLTSRLTKRFMARIVGVEGARSISSFRAFRTDLRRAFAGYQSPAVFLDVLLSWGAARVSTVKVNYGPRRAGRSTYTFSKLLRLAMVLLTGFSTGPLRLASFVGFGFTIFGIVVLVYVVARTLLFGSVPGFPTLASIIAIFSGAQLFALGIIGEYIAAVHSRLQERPVYVVADEIQQGLDEIPQRLPEPVSSEARLRG